MKNIKFITAIAYIGMVLVVVGSIAATLELPWAVWVLGAGVLPIISTRFHNQLVAKKEFKRINGVLLMSSIILGLSVVALFYDRPYWVLGLLITAIVDCYVSFRKTV